MGVEFAHQITTRLPWIARPSYGPAWWRRAWKTLLLGLQFFTKEMDSFSCYCRKQQPPHCNRHTLIYSSSVKADNLPASILPCRGPLKFIYSEKATNFCKISKVNLSYVVTVKSTVEISQNFVAFLEYMNFVEVLKIYAILIKYPKLYLISYLYEQNQYKL